MRTKDLRLRLFDMWQPLLGYFSACVVIAGLLLFRLRILLPGASVEEATFRLNSLEIIRTNMLFAPYRLFQLATNKLVEQPVLAARLTSAACSFIAIWLFFYVIKHWFSQRVAIITSWLFVSSAWMLHIARLGDTFVLQTSIVGFLAFGIWLKNHPHNRFAPLLSGLAAGLLLYIPGFVWLILASAAFRYKTLGQFFRTSRLFAFGGFAIFIVLIAPLAFNVFQNQTIFFEWMGISRSSVLSDIVRTPLTMLQSLGYLFWRAPFNPALWLGRLPLLDFFSSIFAILGVYHFAINWRLDRSKSVMAVGLLLWVLVGMKVLLLPVLLPICYILVASGLAFMLSQWFSVFPINPFARGLLYVLLGVSFITVSWYNLQHYFIAWPQTPATRSVYNQPL